MGAVDSYFTDHLGRLRAAVLEGHTLASIPEWIEKNTFLRGKPFSFVDHEFQLKILRDQSRIINVRKCSQIGLSEMTIRKAIAITNILDACTVIYTMPTAAGAKTFVKTRVDPVIRSSPALRFSVSATADNTEMKQFNESFLYVKGTVGTKAAISTPADAIFNDEVDFSDPEVMSTYESRLTHSPYKLKRKFSTPTVDGYGISAEFAVSRRFFNFVKCNHCGHHFLPDYFTHVRVPGYYGELREITKENVFRIKHQDAYVECPACKGRPSLQPEYREWVLENPDDHYEAAGYQISPFDAPNIISCSSLILTSTSYKRYVDFINFSLGLPAEDKDSSLTESECEALFHEGEISGYFSHVMGIDVGMTSHILVGGIDHLGQVAVVHTERVPANLLKQRYNELRRKYRVAVTVMDSMPYTETVLSLQKADENLYGAVYVQSKDLTTYTLKKVEEEKELAKQELRQVNINKNKAFDDLVASVRRNQWVIRADENKEIIKSHFQDMKRVKDFTSDEEMAYVWRKSAKADDHFFHAALYLHIASQIRGVGSSSLIMPSLVFKFKRTGP